MITLKPCASSNIQAHGYAPESKTLAVQFKGKGSLYEYAGVTPELYAEFCAAPSLGQFFQQRIRGKFETKKVEGNTAA